MRNISIVLKLKKVKEQVKDMVFANHLNFRERIDDIILKIDAINESLESMEDELYVKRQGEMTYLGNGESISRALCPSCGVEIYTKSFNKNFCTAFCKQCGQKIKWVKK